MNEQESFDSTQAVRGSEEPSGSRRDKQQDVSQIAPTPLSPLPSHKKLIIGIAVIIILLVAGAVGTYFTLQKSIVEPIACTQETKLCPDGSYVGRTGPNCEFAECVGVAEDEKIDTSDGSTSLTTGWKTYQNEKVGFEIKYPPQLHAQEPEGVRVVTFNKTPIGLEGDQHASIEIRYMYNPIENELEYLESVIVEEYKQENILVDNVPATKVTGKLADNVFAWGRQKHGYVVFIFEGGETLRLDYDLENLEISDIFDQMLSTFKFIEPQSSIIQ